LRLIATDCDRLPGDGVRLLEDPPQHASAHHGAFSPQVMASTFLMILFFLVRAGFNIVLVLV
jgi:hypothetical protein